MSSTSIAEKGNVEMSRDAADILKELLLAMVTALVDDEEAVHISFTEAKGDKEKGIGSTLLFVVDVDKEWWEIDEELSSDDVVTSESEGSEVRTFHDAQEDASAPCTQ